MWVGENSKTLKILLVAVPALNFCGFGGFGVLFAPPPSSLGEPGGIVLRFRGFLLLLFRVFRDFVVAPDLQAGRGGICQYGGVAKLSYSCWRQYKTTRIRGAIRAGKQSLIAPFVPSVPVFFSNTVALSKKTKKA